MIILNYYSNGDNIKNITNLKISFRNFRELNILTTITISYL